MRSLPFNSTLKLLVAFPVISEFVTGKYSGDEIMSI